MTLRISMPELVKEALPEEQQHKEKVDKPTSVPIVEVYDDTFDILGRSAFLWVDIGDGEFSLMDDDHQEIILQPFVEGTYIAYLWHNGIAELILENPLPLNYARGCAEDYARQHLAIRYCKSHTWLYKSTRMAPTDGR